MVPLHRIHWPHLLLLAGLPAWFVATRALGADLQALGWVALAFATLAVGERLRPYRADWAFDRRAAPRDASVLSLNVAADALATLALAKLATLVAAGPSGLPFAAEIVVGAALGELGSYALHRFSHRDNWLWRVHLLHHRPERLNVANALTAHPLNAAYDKLARVAPLVLLGLSADAIVALTLFALTQSLVAHANVAGTIGWMNYVVGSAELHRLHHSTDERQAGNFGTALPWWDLVFGTFRDRAAPAQVGVFEPARYPSEYAWRRLLAWPFVRAPRRAG